MKFFAIAAALAASLSALQAAPELFYSKYFKGSTPEYVAITIERDGAVTYQEAKQDDNPIKVQLDHAYVGQMFELADKLDHFQHPLESGLKIANLGQKTFRFTDGAEHHEEQFNYSEDPNAQALLDRFECITESERHYEDLDRTVHFDKLGVNEVLLGMQVSWDHNRLVGLDQFLPLLDRIAKNESYLHIDRERAAGMAEAIRNPRAGQKAQAGATQ